MIFVPSGTAGCALLQLVIIDEAQDMNASQLLLAMKSCKKGGRIAVVGDDRQAIYGFRGADSNSLDRLKGELVAHELGLTTTYRCPKVVVAGAARLVPDYTAAPAAPEGEMLRPRSRRCTSRPLLATSSSRGRTRRSPPSACTC
jgi:DNA helicase IV